MKKIIFLFPVALVFLSDSAFSQNSPFSVNNTSGQSTTNLTSSIGWGSMLKFQRYGSTTNYYAFETGAGSNDDLRLHVNNNWSVPLISFKTTGEVIMNGNVGIGTTSSPTTKLQIKGGAFQQINTDNNSGIYLDATSTDQPKVGWRVSDNSERFRIHFQGVNSSSERLAFYKTIGSTAEVFSVLANGNLGIGTSSPTSKLVIEGIDNYTDGLTIQNTAAYRNLITAFADGINPATGSALQFKVANNNSGSNAAVMTLKGSGNVGIGTATPTTRLAIVGAQSVEESVVNITNASDQDFQVRLSTGGAAVKRTIIGPGTANRFSLGVGLTEQITMVSSGNVGIGTTSPTQKLTVNGTLYGKEVKVDLSVPGPDYVFDEDYKLTPLEDIKTYIDQHKHLPEVPSAKEMEKNGIQLGEMNMLLLKKIEEMTLYQIETQKTIEGLLNRIEILEKKTYSK